MDCLLILYVSLVTHRNAGGLQLLVYAIGEGCHNEHLEPVTVMFTSHYVANNRSSQMAVRNCV
jgi:hypothetical protein